MDDQRYAGGQRNLARPRPRGWVKRFTFVVLAAASLAGCGGQAHQATTGSDRPDAPNASDGPPLTVEEIAGRPYTALGTTQFAGREVSATMIRGCGRDAQHCDAAVLLTHHGWRTRVAAPVVPGASWVWTWLQPDGSVAFVPDAGQPPGVLHPDGNVTPLVVSTKPTAPGEHTVLTTGPPLLAEGPPVGTVWALDTEAATLHPLSTSPHGPGAAPFTVGDATFVTTQKRTSRGLVATVLRTGDGGRTWDTRATVRGSSSDTSMLGGLVGGPEGRMALWLSSDGATVSPLVDLWTSTDSGRSWTRMRPSRQPVYISGMAYTPDGTLLMVEEPGRLEDPVVIWRTTADGNDLEPAPDLPAGIGLTASGGVLYQQVEDGLLVSEDGITWTDVELP